MHITPVIFLCCLFVFGPAFGFWGVYVYHKENNTASKFQSIWNFLLTIFCAYSGWFISGIIAATVFPEYPEGGPPEHIAILFAIPGFITGVLGIVLVKRLNSPHQVNASQKEPMIPQRQLASIMFTDIVGYSALMEESERNAYFRLVVHNQMIRANITKYHGREIKTIGDAFLVLFSSAVDTVDCALSIQAELMEYNHNKLDAEKIIVRIGIHLGDVLIVENDVLGDGVNVAARIVSLAEPGGICISETVYNMVKKKTALVVENLGAKPLKNITEPQNIYKITINENMRIE